MKKLISGILVAAAVAGFGIAASADGTQTVATLTCRPANTGETPSATTGDNVPLVCKSIDTQPLMAVKKALMTMPNGEAMWDSMWSLFEYGR
jgi:hypothetical protein